jgi:hypothetical protein
MRIAIAGAIAHHPFGGAGNTWAFLQYVLGFRRLGCEVLYVEHLGANSSLDDHWQSTALADSVNARYFADIIEHHQLVGHASLLDERGAGHVGLSRETVQAWADGADLFINISGRFHFWDILRTAKRRLYLDLDPGFTQVWQARYGSDMNLEGHDVFVTVGLNIGRSVCPFPTLGIRWHTTLPPVVLAEWTTARPPGQAYTTVADWRGYDPVEWDGVWYGQKAEEFLRIIDLPRRVSCPLELCLAIQPDEPDVLRLQEHGWRLSDPRRHCRNTASYRDFVWGSRGEFTVVKNGYARGRSGWVSDRTVCFLAAGRPSIVQDTAFNEHLPAGEGLIVFEGTDQAARALERVESDYARHARRARELACQYFDSDQILCRLLDIAGV